MTKHKAEKRAVRKRMAKTGERYTTARHYLLDLHVNASNGASGLPASETATLLPDSANGIGDEAELPTLPTVPEPLMPPAWIEQPGMSDEAIQRNTGKSWHEWFALLDQWGGTERAHPEIARHVNETYNPGGWWAQAITVGYERARGMRRRHELPGGFAVNASKTVAVPVERLYAALLDETLRDQWLEAGTLRLRTSQPHRSARFDVIPTGTLLTATFTAKGEGKASLQLQELKIASEDDIESRKAFWKARLSRLAAFLAS